MKRIHQFLAAAGVLGLLWAALPPGMIIPALQAQTVEAEDTDVGVPHADCSFFGAERGQFLKGSLGADWMAMTQRSQLTTSVAAALPNRPASPRGRGGVLDSASGGSLIDKFVFSVLASRGIPPASTASDAEFLRRVAFDLTGRPPTADEVVAFLADPSGDKRLRAIERLLQTPQWADRWAMFFGDLYRNTVRTAQVNRYPDGRDAFHLYLRDSLRQNKPYDQMAREILTSSGTNDGRNYPGTFSSYEQYLNVLRDDENYPVTPTPVSYLVGGRVIGGPVQDTYDGQAVNVARDFLGLAHMDCILCHDGAGHLDSLSVWGAQAKRLQGWQLAAFFSRTVIARPPRGLVPPPPDGQRAQRPRWWIVADPPRTRPYSLNTTTGNRPARQAHQADGLEVVTPAYPFGGGVPASGETYREALARFLTADIQFSRAIVNYIWKEFFSRALVEPADQFDLARLDAAHPPPQPWRVQSAHVELLNQLAESFAKHGFDLRWLMLEIAGSEAYQLSSRYQGAWNPEYEAYFARRQVRRLKAEELHDALVVSSGIPQPYAVSPALGVVEFAMQFPDVQFVPRAGRRRDPATDANAAAVSLLDSFLRGDREQTPRSGEPTILQALHMMNSPLVLARVQASRQDGTLAAALNQASDVLVQSLYLHVLSRYPTPDELAAGVQLLSGGERAAKAEDLMWSLYNKVDFIFNY